MLHLRCRCGVKPKTRRQVSRLATGASRLLRNAAKDEDKSQTDGRTQEMQSGVFAGPAASQGVAGFNVSTAGEWCLAWLAMEQAAPRQLLQESWRERLPEPGPGQVRIDIACCGVCRTDLHLVDGELPHPGHALVPGHEIVGRVAALGVGVQGLAIGQRVGVPWLGWTCGECAHCRAGRENLCRHARFTGWQIEGGYAQHAVVDARYVFALPGRYGDAEAAPLLCAGLIGWRAYSMAGAEARRIGLYGFGAAAHLIAQVAKLQQREIYALTRPGDATAQALARELGAAWSGGSDERAPTELDAALIFAPVGALVPAALAAVRPGGTVVCAGIHMSDIPSFPYSLLWGERRIVSVANLTRADGEAFLRVAAELPLSVHTVSYALADAQRALDDLRAGRVSGAAVLRVAQSDGL
jgi:alcohol dehydrogenase, propanol-preferring